ncbi:MAG: hypothetical protein JO317_01575 [Verrucomicrobiae bacterium]|nr:hypothetical protein [Verrucomicrobiae bacterium]
MIQPLLAVTEPLNQLMGIRPIASEHAAGVDMMLEFIHWFMLVLFVGWSAFFLYTLYRFRRSKHPKADHLGVTSHTSHYAEIAIVAVEAIVLLVFAFPLWAKRVRDFPNEKDAITVHVIAEQFAWNVHYPGPDGVFGRRSLKLVTPENPLGLDPTDPFAKDDITTLNQLHLPVGKPAVVYVTSKDVIHSFGVRHMRVMQDATPGMNVPVWFTPTVTTEEMKRQLNDKDFQYEITCSQLCGIGHYRMRGFITVDTPEQFSAWMSEQGKANAGAAAQPKNDYE